MKIQNGANEYRSNYHQVTTNQQFAIANEVSKVQHKRSPSKSYGRYDSHSADSDFDSDCLKDLDVSALMQSASSESVGPSDDEDAVPCITESSSNII